MNNCQYENNLSAFLDGELDGERLAAFESHLNECEPCREAVAQYRAMRSGFEAARSEHLAQVQWARLHSQLAIKMREMRLVEIRRTCQGFAAAAAVVLLSCFLWQGVWSGSSSTTSDAFADAAWERTLIIEGVDEGVTEETDEDLQLAQWIAYDLAPRTGGRR